MQTPRHSVCLHTHELRQCRARRRKRRRATAAVGGTTATSKPHRAAAMGALPRGRDNNCGVRCAPGFGVRLGVALVMIGCVWLCMVVWCCDDLSLVLLGVAWLCVVVFGCAWRWLVLCVVIGSVWLVWLCLDPRVLEYAMKKQLGNSRQPL